MVSRSAKICLLGDHAVGKTSLVRRFVYNFFEDKYVSAIGVKVSCKIVAVPRGDEVVELLLASWDLTGRKDFTSASGSYLRGAAGAVVVCDITRGSTLDAVPEYVAQIRAVNPRVAIILAANKQDMAGQQTLSDDETGRMAAKLGVAFFATSARTGAGVDEAFRQLARLVVRA
jgi:small GTP-binding protein